MANNGYLRGSFSNPGSDYVESFEILDEDSKGFSIMQNRGTIHVNSGEVTDESLEAAKEEVINRTKKNYDKWYSEKGYPDWLNHEIVVEVRRYDGEKDCYLDVYSKDRIDVPVDYIKEHSNDNNGYGLSVRMWGNLTEYDKTLREVLGEWITNVKWSEEPKNYVAHTWSLD